MRDSFFLSKAGKESKYYFRSYGCCESLYSYLCSDEESYELISISEITSPRLKDIDIIVKYVSLVSDFIKIPLQRVTIDPTQLYNLPFTTEKFEENFVAFKMGKYHSSKHLVAMHNLIRYLWYGEHNDIVNSVLTLSDLDMDLDIVDIFALAHSFQSSGTRALTGRPLYAEEGLMYFPPSEVYIKELNMNTQFNTVFDSRNILIIPSLKIKGSFFDDSEMLINSKISLNSLSSSEGSFQDQFCTDGFKEVIRQYLKYKHIYVEAMKYLAEKKNTMIFKKFEILTNNVDGITEINIQTSKTSSLSTTAHNFKTEQELYSNLFGK